jgi:quinol monooxygenase YgiN
VRTGEEHPIRIIAYTRRMAIVIVQGVFSINPDDRDRFVDASIESMCSSREEEGCLEYVIAADPVDPERVVLSERWESMDHLQRHLTRQKNATRGGEPRPTPHNVEITLYEVATSRPLR